MDPRPTDSLASIFVAFARVGVLGFGGPAAQIALTQREFVQQRCWVAPERFTRALAVYQALPGPEALEMCCWLGAVRRGRAGALAAALGFAMPGTVLVLLAALLYARAIAGGGLPTPLVWGLALAQPVVLVLIFKAGLDLGRRCLGPRAWLWTLALTSATAWFVLAGPAATPSQSLASNLATSVREDAAPMRGPEALVLGLKAGSLSFGGAYTALPILERGTASHVTRSQFLDALAIVTCLPAPLVSIAAFLGTLAGGPVVGVVMALGIFAPAVGITLIGHKTLERLVGWPRAHAALDALAAIAIGLVLGVAALMVGPVLIDAIGAATSSAGPARPARWAVAIIAAVALALSAVMAGQPKPTGGRSIWPLAARFAPAGLVLGALAAGAALSLMSA